mmetsp:Transcript_61148/g.144401  ORF Transcript_61148/g.144401 Transcript_61148/m.144401 type:complete len:204 (-) Transcript_61148:793-1404(-)
MPSDIGPRRAQPSASCLSVVDRDADLRACLHGGHAGHRQPLGAEPRLWRGLGRPAAQPVCGGPHPAVAVGRAHGRPPRPAPAAWTGRRDGRRRCRAGAGRAAALGHRGRLPADRRCGGGGCGGDAARSESDGRGAQRSQARVQLDGAGPSAIECIGAGAGRPVDRPRRHDVGLRVCRAAAGAGLGAGAACAAAPARALHTELP